MKIIVLRFSMMMALAGGWNSFAPSVLAQDSRQGVAFDATLETLRQSVARVAQENQQINARNLEMRAKIKVLNDRWRVLQTDSARLETKRSDLMVKAGRRTGGVEAMKEKLAKTEGYLQEARKSRVAQEAQLKILQAEEKLIQERVAALNEDIASARKALSGGGAARADILVSRQDKESLEAKLREAARDLQAATKELQDLETLVTTGPQQVDVLKNDHERLKKAVAQAETDLAVGNAKLPEAEAELVRLSQEDFSEPRAQRLEADVKDMADRNQRLEAEVIAIMKSREKSKEGQQSRREALRLECQAKYDEVFKRNNDLRQQFDALRREMVELDKKKAALEAGIFPRD